MKRSIFTWALMLCTFHVASSQSVTSTEMESAIRKMAQLIDEKYVFPEKGRNLSRHLLQEYKNQKFKDVVGQPSAGGAHEPWYPVNDYIYISISSAAPHCQELRSRGNKMEFT